MLAEEQAILRDIKSGLKDLMVAIATVSDPGVKATLATQIFLLVQKTRYLLGEKDEA